MMVFIGNGKTTCFGLKRTSSGFDNFLAVLARKLSKLEDGRYKPKHVVFPLPINTI